MAHALRPDLPGCYDSNFVDGTRQKNLDLRQTGNRRDEALGQPEPPSLCGGDRIGVGSIYCLAGGGGSVLARNQYTEIRSAKVASKAARVQGSQVHTRYHRHRRKRERRTQKGVQRTLVPGTSSAAVNQPQSERQWRLSGRNGAGRKPSPMLPASASHRYRSSRSGTLYRFGERKLDCASTNTATWIGSTPARSLRGIAYITT
jgi:hypothetical protein